MEPEPRFERKTAPIYHMIHQSIKKLVNCMWRHEENMNMFECQGWEQQFAYECFQALWLGDGSLGI